MPHFVSFFPSWRKWPICMSATHTSGFFILCAAAVKIRSQGPLWRLMIVSQHRRCFPKQPAQTKSKLPKQNQVCSSCVSISLLKNIIIIKCDKMCVEKTCCHNVLKSPAEIFIWNRLFDFPPQKVWTKRSAHWAKSIILLQVLGDWGSNKKSQTRMIRIQQLAAIIESAIKTLE